MKPVLKIQKYFSRIIFPVTFFLFTSFQISAQTEYLVTVNPSTGNFNKIDSIPGVMWIILHSCTTIDEKNKQVVFVGGPTQTDFYLITLDEVSGQILYKAPKPDNLIALKYSKSSDKLFGIVGNSGIFSLVTINKVSGVYTIVSNITGMEGFNEFALDDTNHRIFINGIFNGILSLRTINLLTGNAIFTVPTPRFGSFVYDNLSNKLYGLYNRQIPLGNPIWTWTLVLFDPLIGNYSIIGDLPSGIGISQGNATYDENGKTYIFVAEENGNYFLYSVDIFTAQIIHRVPANISSATDQNNLIQFRFDNTANKLYALHWEAKTIKPPVDSFANWK